MIDIEQMERLRIASQKGKADFEVASDDLAKVVYIQAWLGAGEAAIAELRAGRELAEVAEGLIGGHGGTHQGHINNLAKALTAFKETQ